MTSEVKSVGIDLGTTFSAVAWIGPDGKTQMVPNSEGDVLTPSVVLFEDENVAVGREARRAALTEPGRVAQWVKRDMGQRVYSRPIRGNWLPPEVIQACILQRLKIDLTAALGPGARVVITVPAYFDEPRRKATADAGEMAGLDVLDIVNEPTAAALAFGEAIGYLSRSGEVTRPMTVLVYDLGGGTFDVTLLRLSPGNVQCLATDGDVRLGGYDWDMRLVDHLARAFEQAHGVDPRKDPIGESFLMDRAIEAKHTLTARSRTTVRVEHAGKTLDVPVTRAEFADMTADLLERTLHTCRQVLAETCTQWKDVDRLLLVGGSTRMPMVVEAVRELTGLVPDRSVHPDEAVARGAAIYAQYLLGQRSNMSAAEAEAETTEKPVERSVTEPEFSVCDVNAHSLGVEGIDPATLQKTNFKILARNMPLPARHTEKFTTKAAGQRSITIRVLQGENANPEECSLIGRTVLAGLPKHLPKNWPIEVTFEYEANGRLSVHAVVPGTDRELTLQLERTVGLSGDQLGHWKPLVSSEAGLDAFEAMIEDVLEEDEELPMIDRSPAPTPKPATAPGPKTAVSPVQDKASPASIKPSTVSIRTTVPRRRVDSPPRWILWFFFWLTSAAAGLAAGYYVLSIWYPDRFRLPW
ncbi:MAG TPA: Hsp70 family protein [Thermoguttaceae bacterium]|nr:Hsp70 family protein [Thermoguttaceae bacterium]